MYIFENVQYINFDNIFIFLHKIDGYLYFTPLFVIFWYFKYLGVDVSLTFPLPIF